MQGRRNERARRAARSRRLQIRRITHPARRIDAPPYARARDDLRDPREIRPLLSADARQCHDDHPLRPERWIGQDLGWPLEGIAAEVERQHDTWIGAQRTQQLRVRLGLGAEHQTAASPPPGRPRLVPHPGIEPYIETRRELCERSQVVARPLDGVEIGDVEGAERMKPKQPGNHVARRAGGAERRLDRPILVAPSLARVDHLAAFQVNDWDDLHAA